MCVRLGFIKPGYAEVYCAHCGYSIAVIASDMSTAKR